MCSIPNLVVIDPCDATELAQVTAAVARHDGPVYVRLLRGQTPVVLSPSSYQFSLGKARLLREGNDVAIISTGLMTGRALDAADQLAAIGVTTAVLHVSTLKPFDRESVLQLIGRTKNVVTAENHVITGGLASAVADAVVDAGRSVKLKRIGIPDCFCESGSLPYLAERYRMGADSIAAAARSVLGLDAERAVNG